MSLAHWSQSHWYFVSGRIRALGPDQFRLTFIFSIIYSELRANEGYPQNKLTNALAKGRGVSSPGCGFFGTAVEKN